MYGQPNQKVVGAVVVGFALVAGAYVISNFGEPRITSQTAAVTTPAVAPRAPIAVVDADQNGIEDWRDDFITAKPVVLDQSVAAYEAPDTLTGQMGVNFFENLVLARGYGPFGRSDEEVINDTVDILSVEAAYELYDTPDITIINQWRDEDIVTYANALALTIINNNVPNLDSELVILRDLLNTEDESRITELKTISEAYRIYRDEALSIPVPAFLAKEHLDLINTFHALHKDIEAMTLSLEDPAMALLSLKRYEDDALGLGFALENMYFALEPHASLVSADDPALLFVIFSPDFQN